MAGKGNKKEGIEKLLLLYFKNFQKKVGYICFPCKYLENKFS
jgi:hypothetical protein